MPDKNACASATYRVDSDGGGSATIHLSGILDIEACNALLVPLSAIVREHAGGDVSVDMTEVSQADDYGVFIIKELKRLAAESQCRFETVNLTPAVRKSFTLFDTLETPEETSATHRNRARPALLVSELGQTARAGFKQTESSVTFVGTLMFAMGRALLSPGMIRLNDTMTLIKKNGVDAIPIVGLISFISGLIAAFVASVELEKYGGHIFIPSLITYAMVAEIGPIMTAAVIAGRTGSAYAAEIGTMKISEELDALTSMGFDPVLFLVIPRLIALAVALPILTAFSVIFALFGGMVVSITMLNLMPTPYLQGVIDALFLDDIIWGLVKSGIFALLIVTVGCLRGFQVRGGAASVGNAATSAVVSGIFLIILFDSIVAIIRVYWG
ncbi:MAG: ABC transporter permease [Desulfosudaceae bacterium]